MFFFLKLSSTYEGSVTATNSAVGLTEEVQVGVGLHQASWIMILTEREGRVEENRERIKGKQAKWRGCRRQWRWQKCRSLSIWAQLWRSIGSLDEKWKWGYRQVGVDGVIHDRNVAVMAKKIYMMVALLCGLMATALNRNRKQRWRCRRQGEKIHRKDKTTWREKLRREVVKPLFWAD